MAEKAEALRRSKRSRDGKLQSALHEVFTNEPSTVKRTDVSGERKRKMLVAIAYSKARKRGANLPRR
mgnify:CR=1 FL=1